jgi:hypothetical protein
MNTFLDALAAAGPAPDRAGKMNLYGRFIGSWELDVTEFRDDGTTRRRPGEWHFGWIGERSADEGASWKRVVEFRATRK